MKYTGHARLNGVKMVMESKFKLKGHYCSKQKTT